MDSYADFDEEEPIEKRFEDLCNDLCVETSIREDAWERYKENWTNYSIDGDQLQWLVCAVYECCRRPGPDGIVDSSYVSLTRLLRSAKMNLVQTYDDWSVEERFKSLRSRHREQTLQFFHRMKKWVQMTQVSEELRERVDRLEHVFCVSTVTFKRFTPIFCSLFKNPFLGDVGDSPTGGHGKTQSPGKRQQGKFKRSCTSNDLFNFAWILFVQVKSHFPAVGDDLVNSYHLLLCCMDWLFGNALCSGRRDVINPEFRGVPRNLQNKDWRAPEVPPCFLRHICDDHDGVFVEAKVVKEHWFRKYIEHLFDRHVLKGREETLCGVLDGTNFEVSYRCINTAYEEFVLTVGDLDERVFLGENAEDEIGTPSLLKGIQIGNTEVAPSARRYMQEVMSSSNINVEGGEGDVQRGRSPDQHGLMMTARRHPYPSCAESQSVSQVQALLNGRTARLSDSLAQLLQEHCDDSLLSQVENNVAQLSTQLQEALLNGIVSKHLHFDGFETEDLVQTHTRSILNLFYLALESIVYEEVSRLRKRLNLGGTISKLMNNDVFLRCLLASCAEVDLFCLTPELTFPWTVNALDTEPFHYLKIVEVLVRNVDFPRDVVKHLKWVVESIIDSVAWRGESPLWTMLNAGRAPGIEDVIHSNNFEQEKPANASTIQPARKLIVESASGSPHRLLGIPSDMARRRLYPTATAAADESAMAASAILETTAGATKAVVGEAGSNVMGDDKVIRTDSLGLFFRQVYHLSSIRLRDLCDRLNITRDLMTKVWTCFEFVVIDHTDLLRDRCLDQILLCCLYALARAAVPTHRPVLPFVDILKQYRLQPQANPEVYRSVLLSIVMASPGKDSGSRVQTRSTGGRSAPLRSISPPPVPKEERGDIVDFYNAVFLPRVKQYLRRFVPPLPTNVGPGGVRQRLQNVDPGSTPILQISPLPMRSFNGVNSDTNPGTPTEPITIAEGRRLTASRNLFLSPVKAALSLAPKRIQFTIQKSPSKELREINQMINLAERKVIMASMAPQSSGGGAGGGIKRVGDRQFNLEVGNLSGLAKRLNFGHSDTIF